MKISMQSTETHITEGKEILALGNNIEDKITITPLFIAKFLPNNLNPRIKRGIFIRRVDKPILKLNNLLSISDMPKIPPAPMSLGCSNIAA